MLNNVRVLLSLSLLALLLATGCTNQEGKKPGVKLFAIECGTIDVEDMAPFSTDGQLAGQSISLVVPCFLIRHPDGDLIWDLGLNSSLADTPDGFADNGFHMRLKSTLEDNLALVDLKAEDIEFMSLSHSHYDHSGNGNMFVGSTFIVNQREHDYMFSEEQRQDESSFGLYSELEHTSTVFFPEEYDVFGDETVVIKSMPGHTPGHTVLLVRLENAGSILLTGDLYTHASARELKTIPSWNTDAEQSLYSINQFELLAEVENARVIIEHSKADFESLPKFPDYLN